MPVVIARGQGSYDSIKNVSSFSGIQVSADRMGVDLVLSAMAACVAKKVSSLLGLERVEAVIEAYTDAEGLLEDEPPIRFLELTVLVPPGVEEDKVRDAARRCPVLGLALDKVRNIRVGRLGG